MKIPTFEECLEISNKNEAFFSKEMIYDGYKIITFNYRLVQYADFKRPIENSNLDGYELRGITFVMNKDNTLYKRYLMMNKFFNVGQTKDWLFEDLKDKEIVNIENKEDGSLIRFIKLPNGKILAKTQNDIFNEQSKLAQSIYENDKLLQDLVNLSFTNNQCFLFELIGKDNPIILSYKENKLVLLKIRSEITGEYLTLPRSYYSVKKDKILKLKELLDKSLVEENKEGWVITFKDGQMAKVKTQWYFNCHKIVFDDSAKENFIIKSTIDNTIDDIMAELKKVNATEKVKKIKKVSKQTSVYFNKCYKYVYDLLTSYEGSKKELVKKLQNDNLKSVILRSYNDISNIENNLKIFILKQTNKLSKAKEWLKSIETN